MKNQYPFYCLICLVLFSACSTEIDLYSDYEEKPVIYGLLDAKADTNFIKITRAFYLQGDAHQVAANPDSSNYPGRLNVRLTEFCNGDTLREIVLDTITIHDKQEGIFYAPDQKLYYTTEPLHMNGAASHYSYQLSIDFPDHTLTSKTDMVGSNTFDIQSQAVNFSKEYFGKRRPFLFHPATNADIYDISLSFTFLEQRTPDSDSVPRTMYWKLGMLTDDFLSDHMEDGKYAFYYLPEDFYKTLSLFIGGDTAVVGLKRYITDYPIEVCIVAGGENLGKYVYFNNPANGFSPSDNEFSLIEGGYGVFSSRMTVRRKVRLGGTTIPDLVTMPNWGFKFIGGRED